ncbi:GlxA family transcriptional regulator [Niveispirillum fermenti]|uniref:GlxA family transcriptional regulator n=2 Tax=Niveispirillum fermenti TaxID=1233113 RepID=UPI003A884687
MGVRPVRVGFLLIEGFALMSYAAVIEPFRAANRLSGRELYEWRHYSVDGEPARPSTGVTMQVDGMIDGNADVDMMFVFAGGNPALFDNRTTFAALRRLSTRGIVIGGVSGGAFLLARAELLEGYRCTIHWEHEPAFIETFPDLEVERGLFVIDRRRITCAGGTAGLDLVAELIASTHGPDLAQLVSDWYLRTHKRPAEGAQRAAVSQRYRVSHPGLVATLEAMEANKETPLEREALAFTAGVSVRQLERLFRTQMRTTIREHYLRIRLDESMRLLRETDLSTVMVAVTCGFSSSSHFSRSFRQRFAMSPGQARASSHSP